MRDLETIATTLTAAETGHLVFATLHTPDAPQTVQRIIDVFPPHQQKQVRVQLADCLQGVISQLLLPRAGGKGRILATEVLVATPGIRNLIREGEVAQIPSMIQMGGQYGMYTIDKNLKELYKKGIITKEIALMKVRNVVEFESL
jgi:twitching motility protein PilT